MGEDDVPMDDKAKRMRDLLSSFYSPDPSSATSMPPAAASSKYATLDTINTTSFDADQYMNLLIQKSNLEGLLQRHVEMAAEIKNLDTDLQMLVYENYNKFISATDTIKRMKSNIVGMETNMEQLLEKIMSVQSRSDGVNTSLFGKREHIEKLHRTRNLLRKVQATQEMHDLIIGSYTKVEKWFIYDLPTRLRKCLKTESYADAVRFYTGAMPIFKAYGDTSFQECKKASEEAVAIIIKNLQGRLFSDSESLQSRAEAVVLLKQLDFPVDSLKGKLLEKLEQFLVDLQLDFGLKTDVSAKCDIPAEQIGSPNPLTSAEHEASVGEFAEAIRAYRVMFPDSENQLIKLGQDLITKQFQTIQQCIRKKISSADLLHMLRVVWRDMVLLDEVLPEAALSDFSLKAAQNAVKLQVDSRFSCLLLDISGALTKSQIKQNKVVGGDYSLQVSLEGSKKAMIQGSMDVLLDFRQLLDENLELLVNLRHLVIDWVQEGFQDFFRRLEDQFNVLSGRYGPSNVDRGLTEGMQGEKVSPGLVLVLAQLSVFVEHSAVPRITEEIAASFSGSGARGSEYGPAFVPGEICRTFRSAGEKFLNHYINMRTQKISVLLTKRFSTPNWIKHKEPREVHMSVDLLFQELEAARADVRQILPQGAPPKHRRNESNGSTTSSRSNPLRDDRMIRSNTQRARSQLLETHLAKLFKQKMEIFTKTEHTQESVLTTIVKLCLKSLQEFVRLQTFNRSGFQQIQLDIHFLRTSLKDIVEEEAATDFLLDEVIVAASERCLDPIPLEPAILDKLIQAKLEKNKEQSPAV